MTTVKKHSIPLIIAISLIATLTGCHRQSKQTETVPLNSTLQLSPTTIIADTILYNVLMVNPDSLDEWSNYRLRNLKRKEFINNIFDSIYAGRLTVYDYFTSEPLTIEQVQAIENLPDYSRDRIEDIMFEETWHYLSAENSFHKQVHSFVLAYARFTSDGIRLEGMKAVFKVKLN